MKIFIVLSVCVAAALCAPSVADPELLKQPAIFHEVNHEDNGNFNLKYVTADGTTVWQHGHLVPTADGTDVVLIYEGEYTFVGPDGKTYKTKYTTDIANAHQAQGDHLPVAPVDESKPTVFPPLVTFTSEP